MSRRISTPNFINSIHRLKTILNQRFRSVDRLTLSLPEGTSSVIMVRVFLSESQARLEQLLPKLFESRAFSGLTVIRGQGGFGTTVVQDMDSLSDSDNPPIILEFYSDSVRVNRQIQKIRSLVAARHVIYWPVTSVNNF